MTSATDHQHLRAVPDQPPEAVRALSRISGLRVLVLNWRDVRHHLAGGAEMYAHEISRRWVEAGASVTWLTARDEGQSAEDTIDGVRILRGGGALSVYLFVARRLWRERLRRRPRYDLIVDCQNGIPFFAPKFWPDVPVVQIVHHVHQDQFATRFSPPMAAVGRMLEAKVAPRVYAGRRTVAVSASTRQELRRRLKVRDVIEIVPNGTTRPAPPARARARAERPTIVLTTRLVPHKHVEALLDAVAAVRPGIPGLAVEIIGGGPEREALEERATALGLDGTVRFHGRLPDAERDALMATAWLTTSTSQGEGWGCTVLEAAAAGVPCLAVRVPGIRDAVIHERTGWLVGSNTEFAEALPRVLGALADTRRGAEVSDACRRWAARFTWDRSAELLAAVVLTEIEARTRPESPIARRHARSDMSTLVRFRHTDPAAAVAELRWTDEVVVRGDEVTAVLRGCDEVDAYGMVGRVGGRDARARVAGRHELLGGPTAASDEVAVEIAAEPGAEPAPALFGARTVAPESGPRQDVVTAPPTGVVASGSG